jgi:hypothetical protein
MPLTVRHLVPALSIQQAKRPKTLRLNKKRPADSGSETVNDIVYLLVINPIGRSAMNQKAIESQARKASKSIKTEKDLSEVSRAEEGHNGDGAECRT